MSIVELAFAPLPRDPRLAAQLADHATSPSPVWLWSADGSHIVWTNAVGAAVFGAEPAACSARRFDPEHPAAVEIARLAATLPPPGQVRLERLRGFGGSFGAPSPACARVLRLTMAEPILLVATDPAGPALPLRERVNRLFANTGKPLLVFTPDGTLLYATTPAQARLAAIQSASALGPALFNQALTAGSASGASPHGNVTIERFGTDTCGGVDRRLRYAAERRFCRRFALPPMEHRRLLDRRDEPAAERRHPLRFVWQMDAEGRFVVGSDEFIELVGSADHGRLRPAVEGDRGRSETRS